MNYKFMLIILVLGISFGSFLICVPNSCPPFFHSATGSDSIPEPDKIMGQIIDKSAQEISKKYDFLPIGVGLSGKFERVGIDFRIYRPLEKDEARRILFDCADILLKNINDSAEIQPYLETKPFTFENVGITIYSTDENYKCFSHPLIAVAELDSCGLNFCTKESGQKNGYKEDSEETFEEARAKLNKSSIQ